MFAADGEFRGKVVLITGAGRGIGRAAAHAFARRGCLVGILDRDATTAEQVEQEIANAGGMAVSLVADVRDSVAMRRAVNSLYDKAGRLDIVFANAGINGVRAPLSSIEPTEWDAVLETNLKGVYLTLKYSIPLLRRQQNGSIILHSSTQGTRVFSNLGHTPYAASKAALVALARTVALEVASAGIRVNVICSGPIANTSINENWESRDMDMLEVEVMAGRPALYNGLFGEPEDVVAAVLFLASSQARYLTGVELVVDGGTSLLKG